MKIFEYERSTLSIFQNLKQFFQSHRADSRHISSGAFMGDGKDRLLGQEGKHAYSCGPETLQYSSPLNES